MKHSEYIRIPRKQLEEIANKETVDIANNDFGGNVTDAYCAGTDDGWVEMANRLLSDADKSPVKEFMVPSPEDDAIMDEMVRKAHLNIPGIERITRNVGDD